MDVELYLAKADQCLAGAQLAADHGQYNNAANRAYYCAYQAAIALLVASGVTPPTARYWGHDFVLLEYARHETSVRGDLAPGSSATLKALQDERLKADYEIELLGQASAERAVLLARQFVAAVRERLDEEVACQGNVTRPTLQRPSPP